MSTPNSDRFFANGLVTLTTDFGWSDHYVAAMKGVMLRIRDSLRLHDLSHSLPPQDIRKTSRFLKQSAPLFPPGTVHLVVVDPGVGSSRAGILALVGGQAYVGPDNGIFSDVLELHELSQVRRIEHPELFREPLSATFHGRDLFAPTAASIAARLIAPLEIGPPHEPVVLEYTPVKRTQTDVEGRIVDVDHFGNLISNIQSQWLPFDRPAAVFVDGVAVGPLRQLYADVPPNSVVALIGSCGTIEVSVRDGSATERLSATPGTLIRVSWD